MIKMFHITAAYLSVTLFVVRAVWAFTSPEMLQQKWVRIVPHVLDTLLLLLGVALALNLAVSPFSGWLAAKMIGLLCYIGFGVVTLRASTRPLKLAGLCGALFSVLYIIAVAYTRQAVPFG